MKLVFMGAIKPPWIKKEEFYRLPFNYCDRWCEKCSLTDICKVYQKSQKDRVQALKEGKDPDSLEFAFEAVHKNLQKTFKLLYKSAKKWGVNLAEIEKEASKKDRTKPPDNKKDPLYKAVLKLSLKLQKLLDDFNIIPIEVDIENIKDDLEVIAFYRTLILAKTARALSSEESEEDCPEDLKTYDDKTSAFIVYHALEALSLSLLNLAREVNLGKTKNKCLKLSKICPELASILAGKFEFDE